MASCAKARCSILELWDYIRTCFQIKEPQENLRQDGWVSAKSYTKHSSYIILSKISPIISTNRSKLLTRVKICLYVKVIIRNKSIPRYTSSRLKGFRLCNTNKWICALLCSGSGRSDLNNNSQEENFHDVIHVSPRAQRRAFLFPAAASKTHSRLRYLLYLAEILCHEL
jgi:hypothetical protein